MTDAALRLRALPILSRRLLVLLLAAALAVSGSIALASLTSTTADARSSRSYDNPILAAITDDDDEGDEGQGNEQVGVVESCADPSIIKSQTPGDAAWYMYCTTDPLHDEDFTFHLIPILRSFDLIEWQYVGDAFPVRPPWMSQTVGMWAPDINYFDGLYYLYYAVAETDVSTDAQRGSAIGVATSLTPVGPWTDLGRPVVEPHGADCCGPGSRRWVFDPDVIEVSGQKYIYYGSYFGGISVRDLTPDGFNSNPASQVLVAQANRYEGAHVVPHGDYLYMFVSATDCCRGPLTGYSVFAGRSANPRGPFVDREGATLLQGRVGGTPVISMNGNRWVGPGHNFVFTDFDGQDWTVYHAIDRYDPYFGGRPGFTKRPAMLDALDWVDGWPTVRGGLWASETQQPAPAAQPGLFTTYHTPKVRFDEPGPLIRDASDEFNDSVLSPQWQWVRPPVQGAEWNEEAGHFRFNTQSRDLFEGSNNASVLIERAPPGDYMVEARVKLNLPAEGCCFNFTQAGLVIYRNDDEYLKLVHVSIWETRQTEFAKEQAAAPAPTSLRYGNTVVGPPDEYTFLRIVKRNVGGFEFYRAYTSRDSNNDQVPDQWVRGGVWTHELGQTEQKIGLVSMGGAGFIAQFDWVRTYRVIPGDPTGLPT